MRLRTAKADKLGFQIVDAALLCLFVVNPWRQALLAAGSLVSGNPALHDLFEHLMGIALVDGRHRRLGLAFAGQELCPRFPRGSLPDFGEPMRTENRLRPPLPTP